MQKTIDVQPVYSEEAEEYIIGAIITNPAFLHDIAGKITPDYFYLPSARDAYEAMLSLSFDSSNIDAISLVEIVKIRKPASVQTVKEFLIHAINSLPNTAHFIYHVGVLSDMYAKRRLQAMCTEAILGANSSMTAQSTIEKLQGGIMDLTAPSEHGTVDFDQAIQMYQDSLEQRSATIKADQIVKTYIKDIDNLLGGSLLPQEVMILAARPGVGKTSVALNIALENVKHNKRVLFFSLEMSVELLIERLLMNEIEIDGVKLRSTAVTNEQREKIKQVRAAMKSRNLLINEWHGINSNAIANEVMRAKLKYGKIDLIIIDYLQLVQSTNYHANRNLQLGDITATLKNVAAQVNAPIICLSQLSRDMTKSNYPGGQNSNEPSKHRKPQLSDLRDSGTIEQDADIVLLLWYETDEDELNGVVGVTLAKHRNGKAFGSTKIQFLKDKMKFVSYSISSLSADAPKLSDVRSGK